MKYKSLRKLMNSLFKNWRTYIILIFIFGIDSYVFPEVNLETAIVPDKVLEMAFQKGRTIERIKYEDVKRTTYTKNKQTIAEKPSQNYTNSLISSNIDDVSEKLNYSSFSNGKNNANDFNFTYNYSNEYSRYNYQYDFSKSIYELYGNRTVFQISLDDLEGIVNKSMISDGQAILFWESLLHYKTDRLKVLKKNINEDNEYYFVGFIPLKSIATFLFCVIIFLMFYNFHLYFMNSNIASFNYNLACLIVVYFLGSLLYKWKFYYSSSILFLQIIYCIKNILDAFFLLIGYEKVYIDIVERNVPTTTVEYFSIKALILSTILIISHILLFKQFNFFMNYIYFYIAMAQFIYLFCKFFEKRVCQVFQPFKKIVLFIFGLLNFFFTKFHRYIIRFPPIGDQNKNDTFYIISDVFSFVCISYLCEFLFAQTNNFSHLFCERRDEMSEETTQKIQSILKEKKDHSKNFSFNDLPWLIVFFFGFLFLSVGLYFSNLITFYFSIYFFEMIMKVYGRIYKVKVLRITYILLFIFLLIANQIMFTKNDNILYELLYISGTQIVIVLKSLGKIFGLILILIMIFVNYEFVFVYSSMKNTEIDENFDENSNEQVLKRVEISTGYERKKKKKFKTIEIHVVKEEKIKFSFINLFYMHLDLYLNYILICLIFYFLIELEKNYLLIAVYCVILLILILRIFFVVNEFKNDYEYLIAFSISFFHALRLITITKGYTLVYFISSFYLFILILAYCTIDRRKFLVTLMLLSHLYSACLYLNSNYLFIIMILLISLPFAIGSEEKKFNCTFCSIFIPISTILFFQLYGFKNIYAYMFDLKESINSAFMFDIFGFVQNIVHGTYINEFDVMENLTEIIFDKYSPSK